ncbi:ISNCY family transposase [Paraliomyxa miuraensis]|uniref:ISNCY family transposase n=1 Tax=Paraliomyxa miuraensis TaxID=376150 RepID=UPI00389981D5
MSTRLLTMSRTELDRLDVVQRVLERRLTQRQAATLLGLGERQVQRLCRTVRAHGAAGLVSKKRGRPSNRQCPQALRQRAVALVRERYADFGPTLAQEKLEELHELCVSVETLRKWMIQDELWVPRALRQRPPHQPRRRRECLGELVQIDGCEHAWFEDRGPICTLLVFVDDATSRLQELRFVESESTFSYFGATRAYLERHGKPVAFYSDRASIFRVNHPSGAHEDTQFGRALGELNIDIICANSPQAKGRVERAHLTLQDRLVKELRLRGISTMEDANRFLPEFMERHNRRFGREPHSPQDLHRELRDEDDLDRIFTLHDRRKLSRNLTLNYKKVIYMVKPGADNNKLRGHHCNIFEWEDGFVELWYEGRRLPHSIFTKEGHVQQAEIVDNKRLGVVLEKIREQQEIRDQERLASPKKTLREKRMLREAIARAAEVPAEP